MGDSYKIDIAGSTIGASAIGANAKATGTVLQEGRRDDVVGGAGGGAGTSPTLSRVAAAPTPQQGLAAYTELRILLARAYADPRQARSVFESADAGDPGDVNFADSANAVWDGILRVAARAGRLGPLLARVLDDGAVGGYHAAIRARRSELPIDFSASSLPGGVQALEAFAGPNRALLDVGLWRQELAARERLVCQVRCGAAVGTGTMVGSNVILTCHHVLEAYMQRRASAESVAFVFDFKRASDDAVDLGVTYRLSQNDPIVDSSGTSDLDFVLARVELAAAEAPLEGPPAGAIRGCWRLPRTATEVRRGLGCLQHPFGEPLKLALDPGELPELDRDGRYFRYLLPTQPGSSGAPVFDNEFKIVALHRHGVAGSRNGGIAIRAIVERAAVAPYTG